MPYLRVASLVGRLAFWLATAAGTTSPVDRDSQVDAARVYATYGGAINRYHGGMPVGYLAAICAHESSGNPTATGSPSLGEFGLFQITSNFPTTVGVNPEVRKTVEGNVFLASLEYAIEAERLAIRYPSVIVRGSADQWKMARLVFGLGIGAVTKLIQIVRPTERGHMLDAIRNYVNTHPGTTVSGYPASTVLARVNSAQSLWDEGAKVASFQTVGLPEAVPAPAGITYTLPKGIVLPSPSRLWIFAAGAALIAFFRR